MHFVWNFVFFPIRPFFRIVLFDLMPYFCTFDATDSLQMITPPFLQSGDTVGITAPAYHIKPQQWEPVVPILQSWGLRVVFGHGLQLQERVFAGNDRQRLDDLVAMMCNPEIKAVFCARGGYGSMRLLPDLKLHSSGFDPKWLIGYSDVTALASYVVNRMHWQCIHGPMPIDIASEITDQQTQSWNYLRDMLFGHISAYTLPSFPLNRYGSVTAPLVGGNLSVIYGLNATPYQWQTDDRILFIEDVNENLYHLDRMMTNLHIGGQLENLKGLLVGSMNGMKTGDPSFGKMAYEIIAEHTDAYDYPVAFGFPAGHEGVNFPMILGADMCLNVTVQNVIVDQSILHPKA